MLTRFLLLLTLSIATTASHLIAQDTPGAIRKVTLYRGQALVTREIEIPAGEVDRELTIGRLPENVIADSVYAEGSDTIEVRGVRVIRQASTDSSRADVRQLSEQVAKLGQQRERATRKMQLLNKKVDYIDQIMEFSATTTHADLGRGVLNATTLTELANFSMDKQAELNEAQLELELQIAALNEQEALFKRELELRTQSVAPLHEAKLQIAARGGRAGTVKLSYLVTGCGWDPQYTVRGVTGQVAFDLRYSALVQQMSGEDWHQVQLALSTTSPSISATGPALTPLRVNIAAPNNHSNAFATSEELTKQSATLRERMQATESQFTAQAAAPNNFARDFELNNLANEIQHIELQADSSQLKTLADDATDDVASQVYNIEQLVSLPSRREQQLVQVFDAKLPGKLYHVATPLLSSFAYREAEMTNNRPAGLLKGPAMIYLDDRFIGRSQIPSIASGQHLVVGFGADQQIRTRRELLDKSDEMQGGNRRMTFTYRLVVANFKNESVQLRLFDRLPFTGQSTDISVQLSQPEFPISADGLYARLQKPRGILRWDLEVPAERFGEKAFDVEYSYSAEFDRSRMLTAIHPKEQLESDYLEFSTPSGGMGGGGMGGGMGGMGGMFGK
jgi:uncharacterized protein (TIGR02231 family)